MSLDYLVGNTELLLDKTIVKRISDTQKLDKNEREHVNPLLDAFLKDSRIKKIYS